MKTFFKVLLILFLTGLLAACCFICCFGSLWFVMLASGNSSSSGIRESVITNSKGNTKDKIAVVNVSGAIMDSADSLSSDAIAVPDTIIKELQHAHDDADVKAIILQENTPGGTVIGAQKICAELNTIRKDKPVITYIDSMGASGGYYIANCTDYIIANRDAITGSIGVLIQQTDISGLLQKIGVNQKTLTNTQGTLKTEQDFFQDGSTTEKIYKTILDEAFDEFLTVVADGRKNGTMKLTRDQVSALADGRIYSGKQAAANGLVDKEGTFDSTVLYIQQNHGVSYDAAVVEYSSDSLFGGLLGKTFASSIKSLIPGSATDQVAADLAKTLKPGVYSMYLFQGE